LGLKRSLLPRPESAWGIIIFLATEIIRGRANKKERENSK